ncbi:hypothetical protein [Mycolicibacterium hodleri]|nr:hypothetical protein [Mycolicibacterium hodleri]
MVVIERVVRVDGEFAAGETDPKPSMGIGAGQGTAWGDKCPLPITPG